ncbi:transcription factor AP-4 isoform X1 [Lethenteron reissneri]|uniref:transcription factor AP-4 isoform X1 n=2 Tax=Lethenteron reissneri TaxID=7753 RepID=UPI002AB633CA|nr:transcription factor AP-4 isoform X1 [Lethenteron reissneri]
MAYFVVPSENAAAVALGDFRKAEQEVIGGLCSLGNVSVGSPESQRDTERRIRREIANSNERRRMQSINAGFQSLKTLIPHTDGEKLSKAAILQQTAEYIYSLEQEKTRLLQQNAHLKRLVQECDGGSPLRARRGAEERDEGIGSPDILEEDKAEELRRDLLELRASLDKERRLRLLLQEQVRSMEAQLYPEKLKGIAQQLQIQPPHRDTALRIDPQQQQQQQQLQIHIQQQQQQHMLQQQQQHILGHKLQPQRLSEPQQHPTVIVPAPPPHHVTVVTMAPPSSVISSASTSRQNLDTIVQAIQHIEGTHDGGRPLHAVAAVAAASSSPLRRAGSPSDEDGDDADEGARSEVIIKRLRRHVVAAAAAVAEVEEEGEEASDRGHDGSRVPHRHEGRVVVEMIEQAS